MDSRVFTFGLFWTVVLWILVYRHVDMCVHMLLRIEVGGGLGDWLKTVGLSLWETAEVLYTVVVTIWQRRHWWPTPLLLSGKSHGRRSLVGSSPWGHWKSDMIEWIHFHFSLSCIGEANGNPPQYSCLENTRDWGAWRSPIYGVTQSQTRLMWLSSSSSSTIWQSPEFRCIIYTSSFVLQFPLSPSFSLSGPSL